MLKERLTIKYLKALDVGLRDIYDCSDESEEFWRKEHGPYILKCHFSSEWSFGRYPKFSEDIARKAYTGVRLYIYVFG